MRTLAHDMCTHAMFFVVLIGMCGCTEPPREHAAVNDPRIAVVLPAEGQQAVLREMRSMLGAISGGLAATAREDTTALFAALRPAGTAAAADPALESLLPPAWKELAERTHTAFDRVEVQVRRTPRGQAMRDTVLTHLAQIGATCNACHEQFRLSVQ